MLYSTRFKLIASIAGVAFLVGAVSLFVGGRILYQSVLNEANNRVRLDLNSAYEIYDTHLKKLQSSLEITSLDSSFRSALMKGEVSSLVKHLEGLAKFAKLDFLGVVTRDGKTVCRIGRQSKPDKKNNVVNPLAKHVIERMVPVSGTIVLSGDFLSAENPELAERARIRVISPTKAGSESREERTAGMALASAIPLVEQGNVMGVIYGGILLNRNETIVSRVETIVFQKESYKGQNVGATALFLADRAISTSVVTPEGKRYIGTRVPESVRKHVLDNGKIWTDRAFVMGDRYIAAYKPIEDIFDGRVGMLYVGILEKKYTDIWKKTLTVFILITFAGMIFAVGLGYVIANKIMGPVDRLIRASQQVSQGNMTPDIGPIAQSEIGLLQKTFKDMVKSLEERDRRSRAESENRLLMSEKQASIGRLAAGVAHEINNPLTGVLTYTYMLLRRKDIDKEVREYLEVIAKSTERVRKIVKELLDFSRQTKLDREVTDINRLVRPAIAMMENQALVKGVSIVFNPGENLPDLTVDRSQLQGVLLNMIINALDATDPGGSVTVSTALSLSASDKDKRGIQIAVEDTGCGIPSEHLDKLFDPFFTTKEVGHGTGLGLSVSFGIVQRHGGTIWVKSDVGKGSTFFIWIPITNQHEQ